MGPIMAIGGVDMLIPPSALTVLLGSLAGISISRLLLAGIVPGVLLAASFVGYIVIRTVLDPGLAPAFAHEAVRGWARWRPLVVYVLPLVIIFVVVVLAMAAGWATPTESAAIGAVATVLVAAMYRALTWDGLLKALLGTAGISGVILLHHRGRDHLLPDPDLLGGDQRAGGGGAGRPVRPRRRPHRHDARSCSCWAASSTR